MQQRNATAQLTELLFLVLEVLCSNQTETLLTEFVVVVLTSAKYTPMKHLK
jgi:hypothetical protein